MKSLWDSWWFRILDVAMHIVFFIAGFWFGRVVLVPLLLGN